MIPLFPKAYDHFVCPVCKSGNQTAEKIIFQGIHVLADISCTNCKFKYYQDLPMGQAISTPAIIDQKGLKLLSPPGSDWFFDPLISSLRSPAGTEISVQRVVNKKIEPGNTVI